MGLSKMGSFPDQSIPHQSKVLGFIHLFIVFPPRKYSLWVSSGVAPGSEARNPTLLASLVPECGSLRH